jgi:hypothetical protein
MWSDSLAEAQSSTRNGVTGDLVSIHSREEQDIVWELAGFTNVWIGATDREGAAPQRFQNGYLSPQESIQLEVPEFVGQENVDGAKFAGWAWTSGEPFTYNNWASGEPNNWNGSTAAAADEGWEDVAEIWANEGVTWNDAASGYGEDEPVVPTLQPNTSTDEGPGRGPLREFVIEYRTNSPAPLAGIDQVGEAADPSECAPATGPPVKRLEAGDADQDFDFDQLDLVRVQIAAKYLTGQAATWGQGDWNGAPGGSQGSPPAGDNLFNQTDIIAALNANKYLKGPYAALANANGVRGDGQTSIIYNAGTGEVAVDAPAGTNLTSVNIDSAGRIFTGAPAQNLGGSFDNDADGNIFKATFGSSFGSLSFGNVAQTGLSQQFVLNDLTVVGSLAGGGALGNVDLIYIPEPSTIALLGLGMAGALLARLRRRS